MDRAVPVVVVGRNNLGLSKKTVASVMASDVPVELLFVDNDSHDGTAAWINTKSVATIFTQEQWALARCWNVALKTLWKAGHTVAIIANNDIECRPDAVRLLVEHGGPFVTCVSVNNRDQLGVPGDRTVDELRTGQRPRPDFSFFAIRKEVTDKAGWFNEECFPCFYEDNFYHVAMHNAGIHAVCVSLPFLHYGSSTIKLCDEGERKRIQRGAAKNKDMFRAKYGCVPATPEYDLLFA